MSAFVGLEIAKLRKTLATAGFFTKLYQREQEFILLKGNMATYKWFVSSVCTAVDLEMCLLKEDLAARWDITLILFPRPKSPM